MRPALLAILLLLLAMTALFADQIHRNHFEGREIAWRKGPADGAYREIRHTMTNAEKHTGQQSEHLQLIAETGNYIHYVYPIGPADLADLTASVWIRANRPGIQIAARLVLPKEHDPSNLDSPMATVIRGDAYQLQGRWQRIELRRARDLVRQQQQLMQAELKREVNIDGAYIDQVMLNVYGGPGLTEVWIDDLEVGPLADAAVVDELVYHKASLTKGGTKTVAPSPMSKTDGPMQLDPVQLQAPRHAVIELNQQNLKINGQPFFIRGIRHSDTPLKTLRDAGFNTLWVDPAASPATLNEAANLGFWLAPILQATGDGPNPAAPSSLMQAVTQFPCNDAVLCWDVGAGLADEQAGAIAKAVKSIQNADPYKGRPIAGAIWDGFQPYGRSLDMIGNYRWPLMTSLELNQYRLWLSQRRDLARPGSFLWTWVQTHLPDWYTNLVYEQIGIKEFKEPIGPQPEQIRLLTYISLASGYRGLGFWSDRFLANSHQGRDRLLALALLNQELEMLEPMLATVRDQYWIKTKHPEVQAAVLRYDGGTLVLPMWIGKGAQYVPGQMAVNNLDIIVPQVPADAQVWEVTPGGVWSPHRERVAGGVKITLPEFGLTTALVFTSNIKTIATLQESARKSQKLAAQWSYDLAIEELHKVERIDQQLTELGQGVPEASRLLADARKKLDSARLRWQRGTDGDLAIAYAETQRAMRPLRILMRASWERAIQPLDTPAATPFSVSYFTLPMYYPFYARIHDAHPGSNLLPLGNFEAGGQSQVDWTPQEVTMDQVVLSGQRVAEYPQEGRQCLKLEVKPQDAKIIPGSLERTYLAWNSPEIRLNSGSLVRISGWVKIPTAIQASADGILFFDSIGGEPLAVRLTEPTPWKKFTLYRQVPASGTVTVTAALTGIGTAYFDDIRVEPMIERGRPAEPVAQGK